MVCMTIDVKKVQLHVLYTVGKINLFFLLINFIIPNHNICRGSISVFNRSYVWCAHTINILLNIHTLCILSEFGCAVCTNTFIQMGTYNPMSRAKSMPFYTLRTIVTSRRWVRRWPIDR